MVHQLNPNGWRVLELQHPINIYIAVRESDELVGVYQFDRLKSGQSAQSFAT